MDFYLSLFSYLNEMWEDLIFQILLVIFGAVIGILINHYTNIPFLKITGTSQPIQLTLEAQEEPNFFYAVNAYRINVSNNKKCKFFGDAAKGCLCEVKYNNAPLDKFRLPWIYGNNTNMTMDVNSENDGDIDFCARCVNTGMPFNVGELIAPLNGDYNRAQKIGDGRNPITGKIKITSENRGFVERNFVITPIENNQLQLIFE